MLLLKPGKTEDPPAGGLGRYGQPSTLLERKRAKGGKQTAWLMTMFHNSLRKKKKENIARLNGIHSNISDV